MSAFGTAIAYRSGARRGRSGAEFSDARLQSRTHAVIE